MTLAFASRYIGESPVEQFIDLCTVSKVSLVLLPDRYHGYVLRGSNQSREHANASTAVPGPLSVVRICDVSCSVGMVWLQVLLALRCRVRGARIASELEFFNRAVCTHLHLLKEQESVTTSAAHPWCMIGLSYNFPISTMDQW